MHPLGYIDGEGFSTHRTQIDRIYRWHQGKIKRSNIKLVFEADLNLPLFCRSVNPPCPPGLVDAIYYELQMYFGIPSDWNL